MGVINCERHGRRSFVVVCEHVHGQIESGRAPLGYRIEAVPSVVVCENCFEARGFHEAAKLPGPPEFIQDDPHSWSREMIAVHDEWAGIMLEAVGPLTDALENKSFYCVECFEALDPKYLSRLPG